MTRMINPLRILAISTIVILAAVQAFADFDDTIRKSFDVKPGGTIVIDTDLGNIVVRGRSAATEVTIAVERSVRTSDRAVADRVLGRLDIDFRQSGDDVTVKARFDGPRNHDHGMSLLDLFGLGRNRDRNRLRLNYVVTVPSSFNVEFRTSGGNIVVDDLNGSADVRTSGGNLSLGRIDGPVTGNTSGGDITVARSLGRTEVRTSGGDITVDESEGPVDARTSGGDIRIHSARGTVFARSSGGRIEAEGALGAIDASTSGGSVVARLTEQPTRDCKLSTSGGSITVYVSDGIGFELDARASGGSVDADVPVTVQGRFSKDRLEGRVNHGGPTLVVRTSGGGIRLREF